MRITYLDINSSYSHTSFALPMLHAANRDLDHDWQKVTATINDTPTLTANAVFEQKPDLILATFYLFTHEFSLKVLRRIHALLPSCKIFLGGPEFLGDNEAFLQANPFVTGVIRGEGELALGQLLTSLETAEDYSTITGLCGRIGAGQYFDNGKAVLSLSEWERLPSPITDEFYNWSRPFVQIETSRGCPHTCTFCTSTATGKPRWRSVAQVREEFNLIRDRGITDVRLLDRTFNASPRKALDRLQLFADEFSDMRIHLELHPAFLTKELRQTLAQAPDGQLHLEVGLQSTDSDVLSACGRAGTRESTLEGLQFLCSCKNLDIHVDLLAGLPQLTIDQYIGALSEVSCLGPSEIQMETLKILPGTPIINDVEQFNIAYAQDPPYEVLATQWMSPTDLAHARRMSLIGDRFYNHPTLQPAVIAAAQTNADFYSRFHDYLCATIDLEPPLSLERRAHLLYDFLHDGHPLAAGKVSYAWMMHGLSGNQCPGGNVKRWKHGLPNGVTLEEGRSEYDARVAQIWHLPTADRQYWFVFDRSVSRQRPLAVYSQEGGLYR